MTVRPATRRLRANRGDVAPISIAVDQVIRIDESVVADESVPPEVCLDCGHHLGEQSRHGSGCTHSEGCGPVCGCRCVYPANPDGVPF